LQSVSVDVCLEREAVWRAGVGGRFDLTPTGELLVSKERRAEVLIFAQRGELDLATSALLERELHAAEAARPTRLVVDLTGFEFIDSAGLKTLARAHERTSRTSENGRQLSLRRGPRSVQRLFELTNSVGLFTFDD